MSSEHKRILNMRKAGRTIAEIAKKINRSIFYVYSRINSSYMPKKAKRRRKR